MIHVNGAPTAAAVYEEVAKHLMPDNAPKVFQEMCRTFFMMGIAATEDLGRQVAENAGEKEFCRVMKTFHDGAKDEVQKQVAVAAKFLGDGAGQPLQ